ncbi:hypothetical protein FRC17_010457 [Serendipita sp. 399]|nr:hypothetical protein FRC17_010457 [Serendipita sp. 399]
MERRHTEERQYLRQQLDKDHRPADPYVLYNRKAAKDEENFLDDCNQSMDTLLVFAGLFSAVTAALIVESLKDLKPSPETYTERLLQALLKGQADPSGSSRTVERDAFSPSKSAIATNALFFSSLSFSLLAALAAILVKQWTRKVFLSIKKRDSPREQAKEHRQKRKGIDEWGIPQIIATIPMILHLALACFFGGLVVWLKSLHYVIYILTATEAAIAMGLYVMAAVIASVCPSAPFRWPVSFAFTLAFRWLPKRDAATILPLSVPGTITMRPGNTPVMSTLIDRADASSEPSWEKSVDDVDFLVFSDILNQVEVTIETEAVVDALRRQLIVAAPRVGTASPAFAQILQKVVNITNSCRVYQGGVYDIRPGVSLERVMTIARFIEVALQTIDLDAERHKTILYNFKDLAEFMLERGKYNKSAPEIALYASIVARIHRKYRIWDHLDNARDTINALRDLSPKPRPYDSKGRYHTKEPPREWTFHERHQWQQMISPYILAMTYLVAERYPPDNMEPVETPFKRMTEDAGASLRCANYPDESERTDNYPVLREAFRVIWMTTPRVSPRFKFWMEYVMPMTMATPVTADDGSHYVEMSSLLLNSK